MNFLKIQYFIVGRTLFNEMIFKRKLKRRITSHFFIRSIEFCAISIWMIRLDTKLFLLLWSVLIADTGYCRKTNKWRKQKMERLKKFLRKSICVCEIQCEMSIISILKNVKIVQWTIFRVKILFEFRGIFIDYSTYVFDLWGKIKI